jgi:hypothetical protein
MKHFVIHILHKGQISWNFLNGPPSPLRSSFPLRPSTLSWSSILSTVLSPLDGPVLSLWPLVSSTALCPSYGPLSPLRPSVPLNGPLPPLRHSTLSIDLYPSTALCPLYSHMSPLQPSDPYKTCFVLTVSQNDGVVSVFRITKHVMPKQAISRNSETSDTTPLVLWNSETRFEKHFAGPFCQKPYKT